MMRCQYKKKCKADGRFRVGTYGHSESIHVCEKHLIKHLYRNHDGNTMRVRVMSCK